MHDAYHSAIAMLARREHGALELSLKLTKKGYTTDDIQTAVEKCQRLGLQNDARFVEQKTRARMSQGYGPERIRLELKQLGIARDEIEAGLMHTEFDWLAQACDVLRKKYGRVPCDSLIMRQKQKQFLHYRGFSMHTIAQALSALTMIDCES